MKVTVPVGLNPETCAVSVPERPTRIEAEESVVEIVVANRVTVTVSEPHVLDAMVLLPSPLYAACQL